MSLSATKTCLTCGKALQSHNVHGYCKEHLKEHQDQEKLRHWKETGDTGCATATTLRNCIRDYILTKQDNCCAICGMPNTWHGQELKFILDHIDGNAANNWEDNLRLVCPNCDSQLDTFKSKNKNSARTYR